jgi:hypothetical protein
MPEILLLIGVGMKLEARRALLVVVDVMRILKRAIMITLMVVLLRKWLKRTPLPLLLLRFPIL